MKINVESYSITGLTPEDLSLIYTAICHFPTNHPRSIEFHKLMDKFATMAADMKEREEDGSYRGNIRQAFGGGIYCASATV